MHGASSSTRDRTRRDAVELAALVKPKKSHDVADFVLKFGNGISSV